MEKRNICAITGYISSGVRICRVDFIESTEIDEKEMCVRDETNQMAETYLKR